MKAIQGNYAEIEMGKLAQQNGRSDNVKNFGQTLAEDHLAANQKAFDAAKSMGVTPPDGPNAKQKAESETMAKVSGAQTPMQLESMPKHILMYCRSTWRSPSRWVPGSPQAGRVRSRPRGQSPAGAQRAFSSNCDGSECGLHLGQGMPAALQRRACTLSHGMSG
jgi:Domain of unknown function (DUF4142)